MKKYNWKTSLMEGIFIGSMVFAIAMVFGLSSCGDASKSEDSKEMAEEHNEAKFNDNKTEDDAQFLVNAAEN